ncbi:Protein CBG18326, partial [Caenorhabditis briggsae]
NTGLVIAGVAGATALVISAAAVPFVAPALRRVCIPYVPATTEQLANVSRALNLATKNSKGTLIDLGSGDGRVVLQCAKEGYKSTGVELNSILVAYSKYRSIKEGLGKEARFMRKNIFKTDLSPYEIAVIFGAESLMGDLVPKLSEMRSNTNLLACRFPLPENDAWKLEHQIGEGIDAVWVYKRN